MTIVTVSGFKFGILCGEEVGVVMVVGFCLC